MLMGSRKSALAVHGGPMYPGPPAQPATSSTPKSNCAVPLLIGVSTTRLLGPLFRNVLVAAPTPLTDSTPLPSNNAFTTLPPSPVLIPPPTHPVQLIIPGAEISNCAVPSDTPETVKTYVTERSTDVEPPVVNETPLVSVEAPKTPVLRSPVPEAVRTPESGDAGQENDSEPLLTLEWRKQHPGPRPLY